MFEQDSCLTIDYAPAVLSVWVGSFHKLRVHLGVGRWSEKHLKYGFANRTKSEEKSVQLDRGSFVPK